MNRMPEPSLENGFLSDHIDLLRRSLKRLTGRDLVEDSCPPFEAARQIWEAPFFVASHNVADDPVLTYGNRCALDLFEATWEQFTALPSRLTAEQPERRERERLLKAVREHGYIDDYSGIRVSQTGKRFLIRQATVWNLIDETNVHVGQAAMFRDWEPLDS